MMKNWTLYCVVQKCTAVCWWYSVSVTIISLGLMCSPSQNVLKLILKIPDLSHLGPIWPNSEQTLILRRRWEVASDWNQTMVSWNYKKISRSLHTLATTLKQNYRLQLARVFLCFFVCVFLCFLSFCFCFSITPKYIFCY